MEIVKQSRAEQSYLVENLRRSLVLMTFLAKEGSYPIPLQFGLRSNAACALQGES